MSGRCSPPSPAKRRRFRTTGSSTPSPTSGSAAFTATPADSSYLGANICPCAEQREDRPRVACAHTLAVRRGARGFPIHVPRLYSTLLRDIGCGHQRLGRPAGQVGRSRGLKSMCIEIHVYRDLGERVRAASATPADSVSVSFVEESGSSIEPHHVRLDGPAPTNADHWPNNADRR